MFVQACNSAMTDIFHVNQLRLHPWTQAKQTMPSENNNLTTTRREGGAIIHSITINNSVYIPKRLQMPVNKYETTLF